MEDSGQGAWFSRAAYGEPLAGAELDEEAIAGRAYEISQRADGGSPEENWARAREELLNEAGSPPATE
jgi:hypothetical protein